MNGKRARAGRRQEQEAAARKLIEWTRAAIRHYRARGLPLFEIVGDARLWTEYVRSTVPVAERAQVRRMLGEVVEGQALHALLLAALEDAA